jgi:hypothetical protein
MFESCNKPYALLYVMIIDHEFSKFSQLLGFFPFYVWITFKLDSCEIENRGSMYLAHHIFHMKNDFRNLYSKFIFL